MALYGSASYVSNPDMQADMEALFGNFVTAPGHVQLARYINSPQNRAPILDQVAISDEYNNFVLKSVVEPRLKDSDVSTTISVDCASSNVAKQSTHTTTVVRTTGVFVEEVINRRDIKSAHASGNLDQAINRRVLAMIAGCDRKVESLIADQIATGAGNFSTYDSDGVSTINGQRVKTVATRTAANVLDSDAFESINFTLNDIQAGGGAVVGYNKIAKFFNSSYAYCCANSGIDMGSLTAGSDVVFIGSPETPTSLVANNASLNTEAFGVIAKGALQLMYVNIYDTEVDMFGDSVFRVLASPSTGIPYDVAFSIKCEDLIISVSLPLTVDNLLANVAGADDTPFQDGDPNNPTGVNTAAATSAVNGVFLFGVSNP